MTDEERKIIQANLNQTVNEMNDVVEFLTEKQRVTYNLNNTLNRLYDITFDSDDTLFKELIEINHSIIDNVDYEKLNEIESSIVEFYNDLYSKKAYYENRLKQLVGEKYGKKGYNCNRGTNRQYY